MTNNPYILQGVELDKYLSDMPDITELDNWFKETIEPSSVRFTCYTKKHRRNSNRNKYNLGLNVIIKLHRIRS